MGLLEQIFSKKSLTTQQKQEKLALFKKYYEIFYQCVHHHHDIEEQMVFPWIQERMKGEKLPERLASDHVTLMALMEDIKDGDYTFDELAPKVLKLCKFTSSHLDEEEQIFPAILKKNVTIEEWKPLEGQIIKSLGLKGNSVFLPWIIDQMYKWGGEKQVNGFLSNVPGPIKTFYETKWR